MTSKLCYRFKAARARQIIAEVLKSKLAGATYNADNTSTWSREIADDIKQRLKGEHEHHCALEHLLACGSVAASNLQLAIGITIAAMQVKSGRGTNLQSKCL